MTRKRHYAPTNGDSKRHRGQQGQSIGVQKGIRKLLRERCNRTTIIFSLK
jgi:hypothetical protein